MKTYKLISLPDAKDLIKRNIFEVGASYKGEKKEGTNGVVLFIGNDKYIVLESSVKELTE